MQALKYKAEVGEEGQVTIPRLYLDKGTPVEVIVLVREPEDEDQEGFRMLAAKTLGYWDNPIDDEVWNNA